jgi:dihydroorotate dehydrogenase electron transfer subunit
MSPSRLLYARGPGRFEADVVSRVDLSRRYYLLVLERPPGFREPEPGMFVHVLPPTSGRFFLRRPLSILDCDESTVSLIIVEKGLGTKALRQTPIGHPIDFIGPLGHSFARLRGKRVLAVAGGVGLAPLYYYRSKWDPGWCAEYRLLYGARTKDDLFLDRFAWAFDDIGFATDDGTYGFEGNVVEMAAGEIERGAFDAIFSCGPTPMLRAADALARSKRIPHYVSLENRMACGMGACRSCVVLTREEGTEKHKTVCNDGPVFDAERLVWEKLPEV